MIGELWKDYKADYLEEGSGRTVDLQQDRITTSEGQSYTMLRAVWMDDQQTFAQSWQWTKDNLQREDSLMSWKFGQRPDGSYGIQDHLGGQNTASDGDTDIALALVMAFSRWKEDDYLYDALPIIESIWQKQVVLVSGEPVLVANDLERRNEDRVIVNPSYIAPYAYRVFAQVDPGHDWASLVDSSYRLLERIDQLPLDAARASGLSPDWVSIERADGTITPVPDPGLTTRFGFEAIRLPFRLALDHAWHDDPRARALLERHAVLAEQWSSERRLAATYNRDGTPAADYEVPAMYGGAIGFFKVARPDLAQDVYESKLTVHYDVDTQSSRDLGYYDANWVWFGMALYLDQLPNLTAPRA